jgi:hypothetical protein
MGQARDIRHLPQGYELAGRLAGKVRQAPPRETRDTARPGRNYASRRWDEAHDTHTGVGPLHGPVQLSGK